MAAKSKTALVAEDEPMLAESFCWVLEDGGFHVLMAETGEDALNLLQGVQIDILVTDIRMPGGTDGWALAKAVRETYPDMPIVFVSGYSPDSPRLPSRSVFLQKPFLPEDLLTAVGQVM